MKEDKDVEGMKLRMRTEGLMSDRSEGIVYTHDVQKTTEMLKPHYLNAAN